MKTNNIIVISIAAIIIYLAAKMFSKKSATQDNKESGYSERDIQTDIGDLLVFCQNGYCSAYWWSNTQDPTEKNRCTTCGYDNGPIYEQYLKKKGLLPGTAAYIVSNQGPYAQI